MSFSIAPQHQPASWPDHECSLGICEVLSGMGRGLVYGQNSSVLFQGQSVPVRQCWALWAQSLALKWWVVCSVLLLLQLFHWEAGVAKLKAALDIQRERWASGRRGRVWLSNPLLEFLAYPCDSEQCSEVWGVWITCAWMSCSVVCWTSVRSAMPASHVSLVWFQVCVNSDEKQICKELRELWI